MVELGRLELPTSCMPCKHSSQLSYSPKLISFLFPSLHMIIITYQRTARVKNNLTIVTIKVCFFQVTIITIY